MEESLKETVLSANRKLYNMIAEDYEKIDGRRSAKLENWLKSTLIDISSRSGNERLLDLGSGSGLVTRCAKGIFNKCIALDLSENIIKANLRFSDAGIVADASYLPLRSETFNAVTCFAVLHHLCGFESLVSEVSRVLKPGGIFYTEHDMDKKFSEKFSLPLTIYRKLKNIKKRYYEIGGKEAYDLYSHAERQEKGIVSEEIIKLFEKKGFSVSFKFHWFGLSSLTDILFSKKPYPQGYAPLLSMTAAKLH